MVGEIEVLMLLTGGALGGGAIQALGFYYLRSRLREVDRISRRLDRFIQYFRITNAEFAKLWRDDV